MKHPTKICSYMYNLLIIKKIDEFSVIELRDAFLSINGHNLEADEARKKIYRQILRFTKKGWLRSEGSMRQKRYFQTELFKSLDVSPKVESLRTANFLTTEYSILRQERRQYKGELEVTNSEIREYQSLSHRFPELASKLNPLLEKAENHSVNLLGKVNGLTKVLNTLSEGKAIQQHTL